MQLNRQNAMQTDFLRIEFHGCCESLDLLEKDDELNRVVTWVLTMNCLGRAAGLGQATIATVPEVASLSVEVPCGESEADEKNARNAVTDLLGLFDPAEHRVVRVLRGNRDHDGEETEIAPLALWPGKKFAHPAARHP